MDREELNKILENHEKWLNGEGGKHASLQNAILQDANLQDVNLRGAILQNAILQDASLQDASLQDASLQNASLQNASLQRANLQGVNLRGANIIKANLTGANIDYSCWPLWCGSLGAIVDARIARQLMYHALSVICDDPEFLEIRNDPKILKFANKFHKVKSGECPELEPIKQERGKEI